MSLKEIPENKRWKYAKPEYERRYLISEQSKAHLLPSKEITDKYIHHSDMRLRRVVDGINRTYKLTKKKTLHRNERHTHWISTIYLNPVEYELFDDLGGWVIHKTRFYPPPMDNMDICFDKIVFSDEILWIAEVEFKSEEDMEDYELPMSFIKEITEDEEYSGYNLAVRQRNNE